MMIFRRWQIEQFAFCGNFLKVLISTGAHVVDVDGIECELERSFFWFWFAVKYSVYCIQDTETGSGWLICLLAKRVCLLFSGRLRKLRVDPATGIAEEKSKRSSFPVSFIRAVPDGDVLKEFHERGRSSEVMIDECHGLMLCGDSIDHLQGIFNVAGKSRYNWPVCVLFGHGGWITLRNAQVGRNDAPGRELPDLTGCEGAEFRSLQRKRRPWRSRK